VHYEEIVLDAHIRDEAGGHCCCGATWPCPAAKNALLSLVGKLEREGVTHLHRVPAESQAAVGGEVFRCIGDCERPDWPRVERMDD